VLGHLLLGRNLFKGLNAEDSRQRMINMPIPDFRKMDNRIDDRLNIILQRALSRNLDNRYPTADELLYDLEHYIYHSGYGPTNETMGKFMRELFAEPVPGLAADRARASADLLQPTAPPHSAK
ncbi:MAG: serine/threonine protein kinase, partial [Limisphaerales bacterium]